MTQQLIDVGNVANDGQGDSLREAFIKTNENFTELYTANTVSVSGNISGNSVSASGNITGGNLLTTGLVSAAGNVSGNFFVGNGALLTGIVGTVANVLTSLSVTGNIQTGNLRTAGQVSATANIQGGNLTTAGQVSATGNVVGAFFVGNGSALTGITATSVGTLPSLSVTGNVQTGNLQTAGQVSATGDVTGGNIVTGGSISGTGNVTAGNVNTAGSVSATGNVTGNVFNANIINTIAMSMSGNVTSDLAVTGNAGANNINAVNSLTGSTLSVSGSITGLSLSVINTVSATGNITGGNISAGNVAATSSITGTTMSVTGNVTGFTLNSGSTVSAAGNITGGNLNASGLSLSGSVQSNLIPSANVTYDLGTTTQRWRDLYLANSTIYLGNAQISANATALVITNPAGGNTVLQGATPSITGDSVSVSGNVTAGNVLGGANVNAVTHTGTTVSVTGNITGGNVLGGANVNATTHTGATVSVTGNITGGNVLGGTLVNATSLTGTTVSVTGNITGGNVLGGALVNATTHTGTTVSVTGNITAGNVSGGALVNATSLTGTTVSVSGNVTGNIFVGNSSQLTGNVSLLPLPTFLSPNGTITSNALLGRYACTAMGNFNFAYNNSNSIGTTDATYVAKLGTFINPGISDSNVNMTYGTGYGNTKAGMAFVSGTQTDILNASVGLPPVYTDNVNAVMLGYATNGPRILIQNYALVNDAPDVITILANTTIINSTVSIAGNIIVPGATRTLSVVGNINGGNVNATGLTGTTVSVTGNVTAGNLNAAGLSLSSNVVSALNSTSAITTTANITAGNVLGGALVNATSLTGTTVSVSGNVTAGNLNTGGLVSATGNINLLGNLVATRIAYTNFGIQNVTTSGGVTTLTQANADTKRTIVFTGSANQTVLLPTFTLGSASPEYTFINNSTGTVSVETSVGFVLATMTAGSRCVVTGTVGTGGAFGSDWSVAFAVNGYGGAISTTGNITAGNILGGANVNATTHTGSTVSVTGNITSGNINTGALTATGIVNLGAVGNVTISGGTSGYVLSTNGAGLLSWAAPGGGGGGGETPNVITISSAASAFATANGQISTNRMIGRYNAANNNGAYSQVPWFWNVSGQNSACTQPALQDAIAYLNLNSTLSGVGNVENIGMAVSSTLGSLKPGMAFVAGTATDILLNSTGTPASANALATTAVAVGYLRNGPRIVIQAVNTSGSNATYTANVVSYVSNTHAFVGNVVVGDPVVPRTSLEVNGNVNMAGQLAYLPSRSTDPTSVLFDGAIYYNSSMAKVRVYIAGAWANLTTS